MAILAGIIILLVAVALAFGTIIAVVTWLAVKWLFIVCFFVGCIVSIALFEDKAAAFIGGPIGIVIAFMIINLLTRDGKSDHAK